mmetsp:Transcript_18719/g.28899  ORF Transcript_18719/g.28899 Transcript_18719/m.28899 type:complete len:157 (-) Transcript_18719:298-768(-)
MNRGAVRQRGCRPTPTTTRPTTRPAQSPFSGGPSCGGRAPFSAAAAAAVGPKLLIEYLGVPATCDPPAELMGPQEASIGDGAAGAKRPAPQEAGGEAGGGTGGPAAAAHVGGEGGAGEGAASKKRKLEQSEGGGDVAAAEKSKAAAVPEPMEDGTN